MMSFSTEDRENYDCLVCLTTTKKHISVSEYKKKTLEDDDLDSDDEDDFDSDDDIKKYFINLIKSQNCSCVYTIHFECLLVWILENPTCPICRDNIVLNTYETTKPIFFTHFFNTTYSVSDGLTKQYLVDLYNYLPERLKENTIDEGQFDVSINDTDQNNNITIITRRHNLVLFPIICVTLFFIILIFVIFSFLYQI